MRVHFKGEWGFFFRGTLKFLALLSIFYSIRALLLLFTCLAMGIGRAIKLHTDEPLMLDENKKHHLYKYIVWIYYISVFAKVKTPASH